MGHHTNKFAVHFAAGPRQLRSLLPTLVLYPTSGRWNDFGATLHFGLEVHMEGRLLFQGTTLLAFLSGDRDGHLIAEKLVGDREYYVVTSETPKFFTLFRSIQAYRDIVDALGAKIAKEALLALNDMVRVRRQQKVPAWLAEAVRLPAFTHGMVRLSEGYFAYINAGPILDGIDFEPREGFSKQLTLEFRLRGFSEPHRMLFRFSQATRVPCRICVVVGRDGVGKTQALARIAKSALTGSNELRDPEAPDGRIQLSRLIAIESGGDQRATFPLRQSKNHLVAYQRFSIRPRGAEAQLGSLIKQLLRSRESIAGVTRWALFTKAIGEVAEVRDLAVRMVSDDVLGGVYDRARKNKWKSLDSLLPLSEDQRLTTLSLIDESSSISRITEGTAAPLSSGQLSFVSLAARVCLFVENSTLLLIDEPETHLHPNLIPGLIGMLDEILEHSFSGAIVATHSAYVVREVPRDSVLVLRVNSTGVPECGPPRLKTFGADVGAISHFIFGESDTGRLMKKLATEICASNDLTSHDEQQIENELSEEALMHLQRATRMSK